MSAITYISGPHAATVTESLPEQTARIRHDYAYLANRPIDLFNSDQPVTRCDRCVKVAVTAIIICVFALAWSCQYLLAQQP